MSHSCRESRNTENSINAMIHPKEKLGNLKLIFGSQVEAIQRAGHEVQWMWVLLMQSSTSLCASLDSVMPWGSTAALGTTCRSVTALPINPQRPYHTAVHQPRELGTIRHICFQDTVWGYNMFKFFIHSSTHTVCPSFMDPGLFSTLLKVSVPDKLLGHFQMSPQSASSHLIHNNWTFSLVTNQNSHSSLQ